MIRKIVSYKMKADKVDLAVAALGAFVVSIAADEQDTFYETNQAEDGVPFLNLMAFVDETTEKYHQSAAHTGRFVEAVYPNCEEMTIFTALKLVASATQ